MKTRTKILIVFGLTLIVAIVIFQLYQINLAHTPTMYTYPNGTISAWTPNGV